MYSQQALENRRRYSREYRKTTRSREFQAAIRARNRAFIDEVNARTVCAHCGAQPIEWHNPEHVELKRERYRIGVMVKDGRSVQAIQDELIRCTPLCRRCHLIEDGRMEQSKNRQPQDPKPCGQCSRPYKPLRRGLCKKCYAKLPEQVEAEQVRRALSTVTKKAPCSQCSRPLWPLRRGLCSACSSRSYRSRVGGTAEARNVA